MRILTRVTIIITVAVAGVWLAFRAFPLQAKIGVDDREVLSGEAARPAAAGIDITVNEVVASGFNRPTQVTHAGDGSNRLFVVEQDGRIKIISDTMVLATPFLDINTLTRSPADGSGNSEWGLLGLTFHPNYKNNGYFYINYTDNSGDTVVARYAVSADPNLADDTSAQTILFVDQPYSNHNGGQLLFSPVDGYLYISLGDGGSGGDPDNNAQDSGALLGKILRIDVDNPSGGNDYGIPPDNPFVGAGDPLDEIWALGLRNPWRFSFDRATGDLYIGDVGQSDWEEIDFQADGNGGLNFGWPCKEGTHDHTPHPSNPIDCDAIPPDTFTPPIAEYSHSLGISVTGGFVYRGSLYPALVGYYFYADFGSGRIWSKQFTGPGSWGPSEQELDTSFLISAFGEDEAGELYVVEYSSNGKIRRLADANSSGAPAFQFYFPIIFK